MKSYTVAIYHGPSELDGTQVVGLCTFHSDNQKIGQMAAVSIMRADIPPTEAVKLGLDKSVCGKCPIRPAEARARRAKTGKPSTKCNVNIGHGPLSSWRKWKRGGTPLWPTKRTRQELQRLGLPLRRGSYGDPAAIPSYIWDEIEPPGSKFGRRFGTSYTHQWKQFPELKLTAMASIDPQMPASARAEAKALGFRTYRVVAKGEGLQDGEMWCPEYTQGIQCYQCGLCSGQRSGAKDIAIHQI